MSEHAGTVVDADGQPVTNATVVDVPSAEHRSGRIFTSEIRLMRAAISACADESRQVHSVRS